jgi:hypothetical protein
MRGCWEAAPAADATPPSITIERAAGPRPVHEPAASPRRDFIPVGPAPRIRPRRAVRPRKAAAARTRDPVMGFWGEEL